LSTFLPRTSAGGAVISDREASSTITGSKEPSAAGRLSDTRQVGTIQHGTAE
jgi:hypothetical protein